jgi:hypothetical protein
VRVSCDFRVAMIDMNVLGAFRQVGLTFHVINTIVHVQFTEIHLGESPGSRNNGRSTTPGESLGPPAQWPLWIDQQERIK